MKIAISNIAWDYDENNLVKNLLNQLNMNYIEIAPTKIWKNLNLIDDQDISNYKKYWNDSNLNIISMQSLLYGRPDLNIFTKTKETLDYLKKIINIGYLLGVEVYVFGSPKNRFISNLDYDQAEEIAVDFFYEIADFCKEKSSFFCIEPNSKIYNCNFITNTTEGIKIVEKVNHSSFCLHLDTAIMYLNGENYKKSIIEASLYLKHFHISAPYLEKINDDKIDHKYIASILNQISYSNFISIEMKTGFNDLNNIQNIEDSLSFVLKNYKIK